MGRGVDRERESRSAGSAWARGEPRRAEPMLGYGRMTSDARQQPQGVSAGVRCGRCVAGVQPQCGIVQLPAQGVGAPQRNMHDQGGARGSQSGTGRAVPSPSSGGGSGAGAAGCGHSSAGGAGIGMTCCRSSACACQPLAAGPLSRPSCSADQPSSSVSSTATAAATLDGQAGTAWRWARAKPWREGRSRYEDVT